MENLALQRLIMCKILLAGIVTILLWASGFIAIELALESYSPVQVALLRFLIASITLFLIKIRQPIKLPEQEDAGRILLMGFVGIALYNITLNYGKQHVSSGTASFIVNTVPIFTACLSGIFLGERIVFRQLLGMSIAFLGVIIIALGEGHVSMPSSWVLMLAPVCQGVFFVLQKPLLQRYSGFQLISFSIWTGTICMIPIGGDALSAVEKSSVVANLSIIYLGLFPSIIAYLCWAYVLSKMPASTAATFLYAIPVVTMAIAGLIRGDVIGKASVVGGALIIAGVLFVRMFAATETK